MKPPVASDATCDRIAELAEEAGIRTVHMLAWRDLDDDEAGGSEVHAHNIASIWTQAGLEVTHRTSASTGRPPEAVREGYRVVRRGSRYLVFPRAAVAEATAPLRTLRRSGGDLERHALRSRRSGAADRA